MYERGEFTKQHDLPYTNDAIILQSILMYSSEFGTENYFKSRDIIKNHLLDNCKYYQYHYEIRDKTNIKSRVENVNSKVGNLLDKLVYLEILDFEDYISNNKEHSKKYRFTKVGRMIGLLFQYSTNKIMNEEIYTQIYNYYDSMDHAYAKFCLIFFFSCYIRKKFHNIIHSLLNLLYNASDDKCSFLYQLKFLNLVYRDLELWDIFLDSIEALKKLNYTTYLLVLFNLKLTIEEIHEAKAKDLKYFEIYRLEKKQNLNEVVVEGYCNTCKRFFAVSMKTLYYLDSYITYFISNKYDYNFKCRLCNKDYLDFQTIVDI